MRKGNETMYICPVCTKEYEEESVLVKHFLSCWKEHSPIHEVKSASRSEVTTREVNEDIINFFSSFGGK